MIQDHHTSANKICLILIVIDFIWITATCLSIFPVYAGELTLNTEKILCEGTKYQTVAYFFDSQQEGPTVMMMAGVHGNEFAGTKALENFMENMDLKRGAIIIIPEANQEACRNKVRSINQGQDLNRMFPGDSESQGMERLAGEIFEIMEEWEVDFLLDLHESVDYYEKNPAHFGQTIILDYNHLYLSKIGKYLRDQLNSKVVNPENVFKIIIHPIKGSSTYEADGRYEIPGITFETCSRIQLSQRVSFHQDCIENVLLYFDMMPSLCAK